MERWKNPDGKRRLRLWLGGIFATVFLAVAAVGLYGMQRTVPHGVHAGPWMISGMTKQQLDQAITQISSTLRQQPVTMEPAGQQSIQVALEAAGLELVSNELHTKLDHVLLTGNPFSRAAARWKLRHQAIPLNVEVQREKTEQLVWQHWGDIQATKPVNAERFITSHDEVRYKEGQSVEHIDMDALELLLISSGEQLLGNLLTELQEQGGIHLKEPITLALPMKKIPPSITVESLRKEGIERRIVQFTTSFTRSGAGRIHNIQATADTMQDMILKPGEVFDYASVVERTRQNSGYREAPIILNGRLVPGIGGGICQVSTTLYNAALRSGLEIVERRNHSLPIHYVPLGQDATFSSGYINFRFRNNTGKHIQIRTIVQGKSITVKLFGSMPRNVQYHIRSKITRTIDPPVKVVRNQHLQPGEERVLQQGKIGYEVVTERIKLVDGKAVQTETVSTDRYQPKPRLVARHTSTVGEQQPTPAGPKKQIIEDGVSGPLFD